MYIHYTRIYIQLWPTLINFSAGAVTFCINVAEVVDYVCEPHWWACYK